MAEPVSYAFTTAGTKMYVSATAPATQDVAGYDAIGDFSEVGEITDYGEIGRVYNEITHNPVGNRKTFKYKGSSNDGTMSLQLAQATKDANVDAGQAKLDTALNSDNDYYFKVEFNDNPDGTSNTILYFPAKVLSFPYAIGGADSMTARSCSISISGGLIPKAAVA